MISIYTLGSYTNRTELGDLKIQSPSIVFYNKGQFHENVIGPTGFEQVEIEFDPAWLGCSLPRTPVLRITGGPLIHAALRLGSIWLQDRDERDLRRITQAFVQSLLRPDLTRAPPWVSNVQDRLRTNPHLLIRNLAEENGLTPEWTGEAMRRFAGEGIRQTSSRLLVERAARLLRETDEAPALIAADSGFCDQSHMIRTFKRVLNRTPSAVRRDRNVMRALP